VRDETPPEHGDQGREGDDRAVWRRQAACIDRAGSETGVDLPVDVRENRTGIRRRLILFVFHRV
jgi:hypothetical protein